jgi:hypothetical protein
MKEHKKYTIVSTILLWSGVMTAWHFLPVPKKETKIIREKYGTHARGFGSLPITATINKVSWQTSIFYDGRSEIYLLPLKALIRRKADIEEGDTVTCTLEIRV